MCAEAAAIAALVGAGGKRVLECAIAGPGPEVITPCGGCRQKLREFASDDLRIHLCGPDGLHRTVTLGQLLPMSFGPQHIDKP
jgi:cytidine deaminase